MIMKSFAIAAALVCSSVVVRASEEIAPYLEPTTFLVARVDLKKIDPAAIFGFLEQQWPNSTPAQIVPARTLSVAYLQALRDAKVDTIFATLSTIDCLKGEIAVLIPCPEPDKLTPLLESILPYIPARMQMGIHKQPKLVVMASSSTWERLSSKPSALRTELSAGLASQSTRAIALALNFSDSLRSEVAEIWPDKLPTHVPFDASPKSLMTDIRSVTLGLDLSPTPGAELVAAATDGAAAARVQETLVRATGLIPEYAPTVTSNESLVLMDLPADKFLGLLKAIYKPVRMSNAQMSDSNTLKRIMLAMHNFHAKYDYFPPRETRAPDGKPLLSWRVFLLPYLDQTDLYKQFHLDESWDSPHNRPLADRMPETYRVASLSGLTAGHTCIQLPIMPGSTWFGDGPPKSLKDIPDGTSNTIAVVVAPRDKAVIWTKPEELSLRTEHVVQDLFGARETLPFAYFDGSIRSRKQDFGPEMLKASLTAAGGEIIKSQ